jgi:hypothetical protein
LVCWKRSLRGVGGCWVGSRLPFVREFRQWLAR